MSNNDEFFKNFSRTVKVENLNPEPVKRKRASKLNSIFAILVSVAIISFAVFGLGISPLSFLVLIIAIPAVYVIDGLERPRS